MTKDLFAYKAYSWYKKYIKSNFSKHWIEDLTDFKPPSKRVKNDIIYFIAIISIDFNELKACVIVVIKLTGEFNILLITPKGNKALVYN